ncbi:MAG: Xaa-Pro peptidase family protein [Thermoplasmata archaeon]|nr:Xaa-Pro peptidase family protein [Thermoplasmata archaeon]
MKARIRRIFEKLSPEADALVLLNSASPHIDSSFFYVFDVPSGLFEGCAAVARADGSLTVLTSPLEEESAQQAARRDRDVSVEVIRGREEREKRLSELVDAKSRIALNFHELTHEDFLSVSSAFPQADWRDASTAVRKCRMVKDAAEIERLRRAAEIGSRVAREIPSLLRPGITELELAGEMEYRMARAGASGRSFETIVGFGPHGAEPHFSPQSYGLVPGQSIVCDFGALAQRYVSDITRSYHFGPTDSEMKRVHEKVAEAQKAALDQVRPGVPAKEVHLAAARVIDASPWKGLFNHGVGHSIGLAVHDGFALNPRVEEPLEVGMAITVEPGIYIAGKGGVRIEDDILVTPAGYEFLTTAPREYLEVSA